MEEKKEEIVEELVYDKAPLYKRWFGALMRAMPWLLSQQAACSAPWATPSLPCYGLQERLCSTSGLTFFSSFPSAGEYRVQLPPLSYHRLFPV